MCGLCGFTGEVIDRDAVIKSMTDKITHRGPDSSGIYADPDISMGFRRLSIIDVASTGDQPIYNENKTLVLTFNGEIYNYRELRNILIEKGHRFYTQTDSEVLVHGFEEWHEDLLTKLRGMFAFAIYDTIDKSVFIARDYFGIKPMHYTQVGSHFVYGSEIKSILEFPGFEKKFNKNALNNYISFEYSVPPETFFENVYCLMPAHYLWYKDGKVETHRYWEPEFHEDAGMTQEQAVEEIEKVFEDSVSAHKISDVEVGCFLSSGVDSSYVSTYFAGQKTFTVGFDYGEKYNEIDWAKNLSEKIGVEHHYKVISADEYWGNIRKVQYHMDQPLADASCIALYFVSKMASEYVKVVLSGEGADELFGGYNIYHTPDDFESYKKLPLGLRKALAAIAKVLPFSFKGKNFLMRGALPIEETFIGNCSMFTMDEKRRMLKSDVPVTRPQELTKPYYDRVKGKDDVTKMQYLDINVWLVGDILLKADRMSMANSLELRVPFLDKEVFKVASRIPRKLRVNKENTKYAMRQAAMKHLPDATAQKKKLGFPVPTRVWLRDEKYYNVVKDAFTGTIAKQFFNTDELMKFLNDHYNGKRDNNRKIWTIFVFLIWYDIYFNGGSHEPGDLPVIH
ncbi:asparagine synthase (glutamine-hydrolyzing) [Caproiciproducens faecalis]|uniref:asparagine synthase (glutamine-hydrolyzing) n=1 Tax=Caproiciproducens faecalis TaxID=2820301 RepID=A0ABS7DNV8_9FIRM|nr:asparagine synthase (glutamine-hydrolyzing) [Caproiciproducens faecalis]MBW7572781.1 asparagine synthase (glutamine-hydrolyzing) [Caproiciproducens faecalis]